MKHLRPAQHEHGIGPLFDQALSGSKELRQVPDTSEGGESPTCCGFTNRHEESGSAHKYPDAPGYKRAGTSEDAAEEMKSDAATLRMKCLECLRMGPATADELAWRVGKSVLAVRPRVSELLAFGKIEDTGIRHANVSGKSAIVWRAK